MGVTGNKIHGCNVTVVQAYDLLGCSVAKHVIFLWSLLPRVEVLEGQANTQFTPSVPAELV
jgi:hypothetical protein